MPKAIVGKELTRKKQICGIGWRESIYVMKFVIQESVLHYYYRNNLLLLYSGTIIRRFGPRFPYIKRGDSAHLKSSGGLAIMVST
jgi:hypothetical protein